MSKRSVLESLSAIQILEQNILNFLGKLSMLTS